MCLGAPWMPIAYANADNRGRSREDYETIQATLDGERRDAFRFSITMGILCHETRFFGRGMASFETPNPRSTSPPSCRVYFSCLQMRIREQAFTAIRNVFKRHGAVEIDTPVFELKEVSRKSSSMSIPVLLAVVALAGFRS